MKRIFSVVPVLLFFLPAYTQVITSSNLPLVIINTNNQTIRDEPKIMADMGIIFNGTGVRNNMADPFNQYNGKIGIEIRGQSSQMFPMKSYGIELWDNSGNTINRSLFGLPAESDWVLYAPYNEKTLLHNFLAYTLSREMGHWAANCRYVEVVINGDYKGIYVLMEKIKRNAGRVNIAKLNSTDIAGDALTGGYIFSVDKDPNAWFSAYSPRPGSLARIQFSYVYPKETVIVPEQKTYLKSYVDSFENAIYSLNYQDKQTGWRKFADESSFLDFFIVNEISRNIDGYRLSSYFYKDKNSKGGKIIAGPVWDYDLGFRNADYCDGSNVSGWGYRFNSVCPGDSWQVPFWWDKFLADTAFQDNLYCRWKQLRQTSLNISRFNTLIDSVALLTSEARQRHFQRWPVLGKYVWPNPQPVATTYEGEIQTLKTWLGDRLKWLDENIPAVGPCVVYPPGVKESVVISFYPNPFSGIRNIRIQSRVDQPINIYVWNMAGQRIYIGRYPLRTGVTTVSVPSGQWASGIYFFSFQTATGEKFMYKALKQ